MLVLIIHGRQAGEHRRNRPSRHKMPSGTRQPADPFIGWCAVLVAIVCFGSFAAPAKTKRVVDANVHPLVYQTYKSIWCFLTSWLVLLIPGVHFAFTPYALLSALFWVPGGWLAIASVQYAGLGISQATWSSFIVVVSFVSTCVTTLGLLVSVILLHMDPLDFFTITLLGIFMLFIVAFYEGILFASYTSFCNFEASLRVNIEIEKNEYQLNVKTEEMRHMIGQCKIIHIHIHIHIYISYFINFLLSSLSSSCCCC